MNAFRSRSPGGRFLFYIGKGTDKRIYENSEIELYNKISKRKYNSIASDESEYNYNRCKRANDSDSSNSEDAIVEDNELDDLEDEDAVDISDQHYTLSDGVRRDVTSMQI